MSESGEQNTTAEGPATYTLRVSLHYHVKCQCLKYHTWEQEDFCNNTFKEINNRKQHVYCVSYCLR